MLIVKRSFTFHWMRSKTLYVFLRKDYVKSIYVIIKHVFNQNFHTANEIYTIGFVNINN